MGGAREAQRDRLSALDLGLGAQIAPPRGPLADPELWAIERQLMAGDTRGVDERIVAVEQARGKTLATRYLRARAALASGKEAPRSIAVGLSEMAASEDTFHELELLTARAWLAAGEHAHARYYARALVENPGAPDEIRLVGVEILEATPSSRRPQLPLPPPTRAPTPVPIKPNAIISIAPPPLAHAAPPGASRPPYACEALGFELEAMPRIPQAARLPQTDLAMFPPARERSSRDTPIIDTTATVVHEQTPLPRPQAPRDIPSARPSHHGRYDAEMVVSRDRYVPEAVESLLYPVGLDPNEPKVGVVPRTPAEARVAFTRMARELGLNYRLWYGTSLRTDTLAIDAMQRHLQLRWSDGEAHGPEVLWELQRHGALLSEILARALGAVWVDVAPTELGYWAMVVPPATRVWPFGRLFRFLTVGHSENDLVSYYLELDARAKSARAREDEE